MAENRFHPWSFARDVLTRGAAIQQDYAAGNHGNYEVYSARLDAAARELADRLAPHLAAHPADDGESVTEEWLRSVGFESARPNYVLTIAREGNRAWWWPEKHRPADWIVATGGRAMDMADQVPDCLCPRTRGAVRRLLAALGIAPAPKG